MSHYKGKDVIVGQKKYKLIKQIGSGGNGCVWSAREEETAQQYAIKFLPSEKDGKVPHDKLDRFEKEISFCQCENHPNIIRIIGHGVFDGNERFYIMPLYEKTLRKIILEETDEETLLDYWIKLAKAVEYIHSIGIYHRDIKPENVFVNDSGELVLADFGIAHFRDSTMTKTAAWLGNKSYAAPEQLEKENENRVSAASDVYALGKILNELFTKNNPSGLNYELIRYKYPQYWELDGIVETCLKQNPSERLPSEYLLEAVSNIQEEVNSELRLIEDTLIDGSECGDMGGDVIEIARTAAKDIYLAKYILENESPKDIENDDPDYDYHIDIHYAVDDFVKGLYFQKRVLTICKKKFEYESNVYVNDKTYEPIDLSKEENRKLYDEFRATVTKYRYQGDSLGKIFKYFLSCCDYHCKEILRAISTINSDLEDLGNAPFFYLLYKLKVVFSQEEVKEYSIADRLEVNWKKTFWC
ncbi:MAG: serine/threonine-protein kinase [Gemmiger sp.]